MTEPRETALAAVEVWPGVLHWRIHNANIGGSISSSHAVVDESGSVLIDPVRLADDALESLPEPRAIVLTATCHQRAAWRYRTRFGAEVWLPDGARAGDEEPDHRYGAGDELPGGLVAIHTPGPEAAHYSFLLAAPPGVLFCSDLVGERGGTLHFIPPQYHDDPAETRRSVQRLLDLPFAVLCLDHGAPVLDDPAGALRRLLEQH